MKRIAIFTTDGFEDIELIVAYDLLIRTGINVDLISIKSKPKLISKYNLKLKTHLTIKQVTPRSYDAFIMPGGPAVDEMLNSIALCGILEEQIQISSKIIGAICAAPKVLAKLKILDNYKFTCHPDLVELLDNPNYQEKDVVVDRNLITANGPGSSFEFIFAIVKKLLGEEALAELKRGIVWTK